MCLSNINGGSMKKLLVWLSWTGGFVSMHRKRIFQVTETHETVVYTKKWSITSSDNSGSLQPWKYVSDSSLKMVSRPQGATPCTNPTHNICHPEKKCWGYRERESFFKTQSLWTLKHYKCDLKINFKIAGIFTFFNPNKFLFTLTQALFAIFWRLDENMWATTVMSEMFMTVMQFNFTGKPSIPH